jgi:predicted DCC family thiol-disulfide oxidoreductase YuxK
MKPNLHVATPPPKPLMIFDGDCDLCIHWIGRCRQATGDCVEYVPFQDSRAATLFPELPRERCGNAVQFIETDGTVFEGAEAVFRALARNPSKQWPLRWYQKSRMFAKLAERSYRFVADHRRLFSRLTRLRRR